MRPRRSPGKKLFTDLTNSGFEVSLSAERRGGDVTLLVPGKELSAEQAQLLGMKVDACGAQMVVDQRGIFTIWFDPDGPNFAKPSY